MAFRHRDAGALAGCAIVVGLYPRRHISRDEDWNALPMIVQIDRLTKSFGGRTLFSDASFQINPRERYACLLYTSRCV